MATMLFTDIALRQMKAPGTGRLEVTDAHPDVKGFTLRITKGGAKTFNLVFRSPRDGRQARIDLGSYPATALKEARRKAIEYRRFVESGVDPVMRRRPKLSGVPPSTGRRSRPLPNANTAASR